MSEQNNFRIAFVTLYVFEDGSIRGGMLITDMETKPYEFRVTSSIKPTALQKILYGSTLKDHVYSDLICLPLVQAAKEKPDLILVKNKYLLKMRKSVAFPVILLQQDNPNNNSTTFNIVTHESYEGEKAQANTILEKVMQNANLFEPFDRVTIALQEVHKQRPEDKV